MYIYQGKDFRASHQEQLEYEGSADMSTQASSQQLEKGRIALAQILQAEGLEADSEQLSGAAGGLLKRKRGEGSGSENAMSLASAARFQKRRKVAANCRRRILLDNSP